MRDWRKSILATLVYHDIFEYPLTIEELSQSLISATPVSKPQIRKVVLAMVGEGKQISSLKNFYFLKGQRKIVAARCEKEIWSGKKIAIAKKVARFLGLIPWVKMIAISGSLAMKNAKKDDDIDLLVVASKNRLWLTRGLVTLLTELVANRRRVGDKEFRDKICLNMFLDENHLRLPKDEQDLYSAHEICQLKPILDKDNTHKRFLRANYWVKKHLANAYRHVTLPEGKHSRSGVAPAEHSGSELQLLNFLEKLAFRLQLFYMRSRRTTEIVEPHRIRFHPQDCRNWVLRKYRQKLNQLARTTS